MVLRGYGDFSARGESPVTRLLRSQQETLSLLKKEEFYLVLNTPLTYQGGGGSKTPYAGESPPDHN